MLEGSLVGLEEGILKVMGLFGSSPRPRGVQMHSDCGGSRGWLSELDGIRW